MKRTLITTYKQTKMPRNPIDYSRTVIYKIVCKDPAVTDCYVGMTTNLTKRKTNHKTHCNNEFGYGNSDCYLYHFIRANGGYANWDYVVLEEGSFKNKNEAHSRERYWLEHEGASLNCIMPVADEPKVQTAEQAAVQNKEVECGCGGRYTVRNRATHMRALRHLVWEKDNETDGETSDENV